MESYTDHSFAPETFGPDMWYSQAGGPFAPLELYVDVVPQGVSGLPGHLSRRGRRPINTSYGRPPIRPLLGEWGATPGPDTEPNETRWVEALMGNRVFAMSPLDAERLFRSWGWVCEGSVASHGTTKRWRWPETNDAVSLHTKGVKRYEFGMRAAISKAAKVMGLSMKEFVAGPPEKERMTMRQPDLVLLGPADPEPPRLEPEQKEQPMTAAIPKTGLTNAVERAVAAMPNRVWTPKTMHEHLVATGFPVTQQKVAIALSQLVQRKTNVKVQRVEHAKYQAVAPPVPAEAPQAAPPADLPAVTTPPEIRHSDATVEAKPVDIVVDTPPSGLVGLKTLNGSTPELLSRVAVLDGGKYLFQGDDGALYVITNPVKLDV